MIHFAVIGLDGRIERVGRCSVELMELQGSLVVEADPGVSAETHYWNGNSIAPLPGDLVGRPYSIVNGAPQANLDAAKARQRAIINRARDAAQDGGAATPSGTFDSAPRSREFLNGAVTSALLAQLSSAAFSIDWTRADNTVVTMDAAATIAAGLAVAAHVDAIHQRAVVLKSRIDAATTLAEIAAIGWTLED